MTVPTFQRFDTFDVLQLAVERAPRAAEYQNLVENTDGTLGAWGWVTPAGTFIDVDGIVVDGISWLQLAPHLDLIGPTIVRTEPFVVDEGAQVAASYVSSHDPDEPGAHFTRGRINFLDEDKAVISSSPLNDWSPNGLHEVTPGIAPAGTVYARLQIDLARNADGDDVLNDAAELWVRDVKVIQDLDHEDLTFPLPDAPSHYTEDVIGLAARIAWSRTPLGANAITVTLIADDVSADTDPEYGYGIGPYGGGPYGGAVQFEASMMRPGRKVELAVRIAPDDLRPLFTGEVASCRIDYDLTQPAARRARITLVAVDAAAKMAAKKHSDGYSDPADVVAYMEGVGVPWDVLGNKGFPYYAAPAAASTDATVLDQLIRTRDTVAADGFVVWVDNRGVLMGRYRDGPGPDLPDLDPPDLTDQHYNGQLAVNLDTDRVINSIKITLLHGAASTDYGPYERGRSVGRWGRRPATFTIFNTDVWDEFEARTAADLLLDATAADPADVVEAATLPILSSSVDPWAFGSVYWATLDLYQPIFVTNEDPEFSYLLEVIGIDHQVDRQKWLTTYTFGNSNRPQRPTR